MKEAIYISRIVSFFILVSIVLHDNSCFIRIHRKSTVRETSNITAAKNQRTLPGNKIFVTGPWVNEHIVKENLLMNPDFEMHVFNLFPCKLDFLRTFFTHLKKKLNAHDKRN